MPHLKRIAPTAEAKAVSEAEFASIIRAHEIFALGRVGARIIPRYVVARQMRCDRRRLAEIDFTGADLSGTTFIGTDLTRASFYCATLQRCDFRHAVLLRADLRGAAFAGANLASAVLDEADMRAAILVAADPVLGLRPLGARAELKGATLNRSNLDKVEAEAVDFTNCSLRGARLRNANLKNAVFQGANLDGADLAGARIDGVQLQGAILTGVDLSRMNLPPAAMAGCVLDPTAAAMALADDIRRTMDAAEAWVTSGGKAGARGVVDDLDLRVAAGAFRQRCVAGLSARRVTAVGVDFSGAELQGANFEGADLRSANFSGADLRGASFVNAKLTHAVMTRATIGLLTPPGGRPHPTRFDGATLDGTGLAGPKDSDVAYI